MNLKNFIFLGIFALSRVFFINPLPVFFDSPEYLRRLSDTNFFQAIIQGHMPLHIGYVGLLWPFFQIANFFKLNPSSAIIYVQIFFSVITIYCFYQSIKILANQQIAFISTIIASIMPMYWITNVTIMAESTYINFFIISLYLFTKYAKIKGKENIFLISGSASFGLAFLTNPLITLWLPLVLFLCYFMNKNKLRLLSLSLFLTLILATLINGSFIANALRVNLIEGMHQYMFGEDIEIAPSVSSFVTIFRFSRNLFVPTLQNNTGVILILSIISLIKLFKENKNLFILTILWIVPLLITNQWFDSLLYGRHGTIATFGFAFIAALVLKRKGFLFYLTIFYILIVSLPALNLLKQPIPYIETGKSIKSLPNGLLIETHFARPQIEKNYPGEIIFVNQPGWNKKALSERIDDHLSNEKPIFITSQALSDPYGIYSGPFLYPLSLSYTKDFELKNIIPSYSLRKYQAINNANIVIYEITSKDKSRYPDILKLNNDRHRMDYFDPVTQLWFLIERAMITQTQNIIKG